MRTKPTENRAASLPSGGSYYFSSWSYEDRAFLRALYKKYPCTKVHLMVQITKSAPAAGRRDCSHWRLWANMARQVRSSIRKQVTPKEMEAFFWDVIAEGTGQDEVTARLDALIFGDDASPAIITREGSRRAPKRARSPEHQPRPGELAPDSGSAKRGECMAGSGLDVTFVVAPDSGSARTVELSAGPDFEVSFVLESILSEVCKMDDAGRRQAFGTRRRRRSC
ncbi:hypothetical protein MTO96_016274 [Rhipicephalus appendiculatus]